MLVFVGGIFGGMKNRCFNLDGKWLAFGKHWYFKNICLKPIMLFSLLPQAQDKKMRKLNITSNHVETKTQRRVNHFSDLSEYTRCWCAKHCVPEQASFSNSIAFSSGGKTKQLLAALLILHQARQKRKQWDKVPGTRSVWQCVLIHTSFWFQHPCHWIFFHVTTPVNFQKSQVGAE